MIDVWGPFATICPPHCLPKIIRAIETPRKVLGEPCLSNFGQFHDLFACMVNEHNFNIIKYPEGNSVKSLKTKSNEQGEAGGYVLHLFAVVQVLGVYQVAVLYPFAKFFTECIERSVCLVS